MLGLALGVCASSSAASAQSATSLHSVIDAMKTQLRIVYTVTPGSPPPTHRVVVDAKAMYMAIYSRSGRLLDLKKWGVEYRLLGNQCYGRFASTSRVKPRDFWFPLLQEVTGAGYKTVVSGDTVTYKSSSGTMKVDARTRLIRSFFSPANRKEGVPAESETYRYPRSVSHHGVPAPLCQ